MDSTCVTLAPRGGAVCFLFHDGVSGIVFGGRLVFDFDERRDTLKSRGILWDHQATIGNML